MKHHITFIAENFFGRPDIEELLARLQTKVRARRGPQSTITVRTLVAGLVTAMVVQGSPQIAMSARQIEGMTKHQRSLLGIGVVPTVSQLRRRLQRIETVLQATAGDDLDTLYAALQEFADVIVPASALIESGPMTVAVDTTLFDAHTPHYSQDELDMIVDPERRKNLSESTKRGLRHIAKADESTLRRHYDSGATYRKIERFTGPELTLGYGAVAAVQVGGRFEQCVRIAVRSASQHDVPPAVALVKSMIAAGIEIDLILADRGFSQSTELWLEELRRIGLPLIFDLKSTQQGYRGKVNGLLEIDGWLFLPSLPKKYWDLKRPAITASVEERAEYVRQVDLRADWAMRIKQTMPGDPHGARKLQLYSHVTKGSAKKGLGVRCPSCPKSMSNPNPKLKLCRQGCKLGEGCATKTIIWGAAQCPDTYQSTIFGTTPWTAAYSPRTGVERWFSHLKGGNNVDFVKALRVRGIVKTTLMTVLASAATNLRLRFNNAYNEDGWRGPDE